MWLNKMKRRKLQYFLVGLMLFVAAALLNLCLCFSAELAAYSKQAINQKNCPDAYVLTKGTQKFSDHFINEDWKNEVKNVSALLGKTVTAPIQYNGNNITQLYDMALSAEDYLDFGYLTLKEGNTTSAQPENGEVWLSETLTTPNHIQLGDTITLRYDTPLNLTVTGIYRTTCFPKAIGFSPMLMSGEEVAKLQESVDSALFAVNIKEYSAVHMNALFENSSYSVVTRTRDSVQASLMEYSGTIGAIGAMAAIVVFAVVLIFLRFIVRTNLLKEYQTIGIYKSLGITSNEILHIYQKGYLMVGAAAITFGAFLSLFLVDKIGNYCTEYVEGFKVGKTSFVLSFIAIVIFMLILYWNLLAALKKVKYITPIEAIAIGNTRLEHKLPPSIIKSAKLPFTIAINELFKYKKSTLLLLMTITSSVFLSLFFAMIWISSDQLLENANLWFNLPKNDAYITGNIRDELNDYLAESNYVKSTVYGDFGGSQLKIEGFRERVNYIHFDTYSNFDPAITGIQMVAGQEPKVKNEVAVGKNLLKLLDLTVGDSIFLTLQNTTKEYFISGAYATVADGGQKMMLMTDAVSDCMDYNNTRAFIRLNRLTDFDAFKNDIETSFDGVVVDKNWFAMENSVESIRGMLKSISMVLIAAFVMFSILNIIIVLLMEHKNRHKKYGILKSLGFPSQTIIRQNLSRYFILSLFGSAAALALHLLFSRRLGAIMLIDAFVNSNQVLAFITAGFIILILSATCFISLMVKKISPVELMEE